jgi:hypothetical protein
VAVFRFDGDALAEAWTEQDWLGRRQPDREVLPALEWDPHQWAGAFADGSPAVEEAARSWLLSGRLHPVTAVLDGASVVDWPFVAPDRVLVNKLISAGRRAAFHATLIGTYVGGLGCEQVRGEWCRLDLAGLVDTDPDGQVVRARICSDRLGLVRRLKARAADAPLTSDPT